MASKHVPRRRSATSDRRNEGDRDRRTLHIRCGSDIEHTLRIAGFQGDFLEFSDPFCIGPVPALPRDGLIATRAHFLAGAFDLDEADALARQRRQYDALADLSGYERIALWFEHDAYDQLILAYVLKCLGEQQPDARVELIAVDNVPGVERFIGIGQLAPDQLAWLWRQREPVTEAQLALGEAAWSEPGAWTAAWSEFSDSEHHKHQQRHGLHTSRRRPRKRPNPPSQVPLDRVARTGAETTFQIGKIHGAEGRSRPRCRDERLS